MDAPVTLSKGATYYLNAQSSTSGGKPYCIDLSSGDTFAGGAYNGHGGKSRDMWFQIWGQ